MKHVLVLSTLLLGAGLVVPVAMADDRHDRDRRYYDRDAHDYHTYDNQEDRAYRMYLEEQHREYREFRKTKRDQQRDYFRWRHNHPDRVLFKLEIR